MTLIKEGILTYSESLLIDEESLIELISVFNIYVEELESQQGGEG